MAKRVERNKTGLAPTAQQDVDVREAVVDLTPHATAKDGTESASVQTLRDAAIIAEELEKGSESIRHGDVLSADEVDGILAEEFGV